MRLSFISMMHYLNTKVVISSCIQNPDSGAFHTWLVSHAMRFSHVYFERRYADIGLVLLGKQQGHRQEMLNSENVSQPTNIIASERLRTVLCATQLRQHSWYVIGLTTLCTPQITTYYAILSGHMAENRLRFTHHILEHITAFFTLQ